MKPFIFPIKSGYPYWISQKFGQTLVPYPTPGGHIGYDIAVGIGTPIVACADGEIILATSDGKPTGYGNEVRYLTYKDGTEQYMHIDAHLLRCLVKIGDKVKQGQTIALSGNTGNSTGPHDHHDVRCVIDITNNIQPGPQMQVGNKTLLVPEYNNGTYGCFDYGYLMEGLTADVFAVDLRYGQAYSYLREKAWSIKYNEALVKQQAAAVGFGPAEWNKIKYAFVYGYWDKQFIFDTANYAVWREMTKPEYLKRLG